MKFSNQNYFILIIFSFLMLSSNVLGQRKMENLSRGLVAIKTNTGVFASWRIPGYEWEGVTYNIYKDGVKINSEPLKVSNFQDNTGTLTSKYSVAPIVKGVEQVACAQVLPLSNQYLEIPMVTRPAGYQVNDATAADLDGDGEYEIIVKRIFGDSRAEAIYFAYFEAYKMDGTLMWEINVGPNIMSSSEVEVNIAAFDLDGDGKAEVFLRTSEGTVFGDGKQIGDVDGDGKTNYRYSVLQSANMEYMCAGPEFLSLINGETGAEMDRVDFIPRISPDWWGDGYGHRANKFFFGAPYLDGKKPSLFIGRGIYTKTVMQTYDVVNKKLVKRWEFRATEGSDPYFGQGNHNYTIADVDMDGRDEIAWGSMTVDDNGKGLYSTQMGHGDAMHVGDMDPFRKGTEIWKCLENSPNFGTVLYDGATGEILIHDILGRDAGRACAANLSDAVKGKTLWGSTKTFSASTKQPVSVDINSVNFRIYWDGDLLEELLDHNWNGSGGEGSIRKPNAGEIFRAVGTNSCNWTKGTPSLQADLFGDWREEVIWRTADDTKIRIYTTVDPTIYRNYTLMHDHQYRQAICWQMCGYNQPPHVSYFLGKGENITVPPPPSISNGRLVYNGTGIWNKTNAVWLKDGASSAFSDGEHVLFDVLMGTNVNVALSEVVSPSVLTVNSPGNYTLNASAGKLSGTMKLIKQGLGTFTLNGSHDYSGATDVWNGRLAFNGNLSNSPVWLNLFGELSATGQLNKGLVMRYDSKLFVGGDNSFANLTVNDSLYLMEKSELIFDVRTSVNQQNDTLKVNGNLTLPNGTTIRIVPHLLEGEERLAPGKYVLAVVSGAINCKINQISIMGILGTPASLEIQNDSLVMIIKEMRSATSVVWNGLGSSTWDLAVTSNFLNSGVDDIFVTGDEVLINDNASSKYINISETLAPSSVLVNGTSNFTFGGKGSISGNTGLAKSGTGKLTITNSNNFTGKIAINEGTIQVATLPNNLSENSFLGPVLNNPSLFEINGGTLAVTSATSMDRPVFIGAKGGVIDNSGTITWNSKVSGGELTKIGAGELVFAEANSNNKLIIKSGTVRLLNEEARPANAVVFEGGTLRCYDNGGTYSQATYPIIVEEGKTGTIYLDGRCDYRNTLTGKGTLNINFPWIRNDISGNWSGFEGTINLLGTSWFRDYSTTGYGKAKINLPTGTAFTAMNGQTVNIGTLIGSGSIDGASTWFIGARDEISTFSGVIKSGSLTKVGSSTMRLTGENTYTSGTSINGGVLLVNNTTGSGTGAGIVTVRNIGVLGGSGTVQGVVIVNSGGALEPGNSSIGKLSLKSNLTLLSGSSTNIEVRAKPVSTDLLSSTAKITFNGTLNILNKGTTGFEAGNEFKIFEAAEFAGTFSAITPTVPGAGLVWDTSELYTNGILKVTEEIASVKSLTDIGISIAPNPVVDNLIVQLDDLSANTYISIYTISGSLLYKDKIQSNKITIPMHIYNSGVYVVKISNQNEVAVGRIIKQ